MALRDDLWAMGLAAVGGGVAALVRMAVDRRPTAWPAVMVNWLAGGLVGFLGAAWLLGLGVHPYVCVAVSSLLGAAGEMIIRAIGELGRQVERDPMGAADRLRGRDQPDAAPPQADPEDQW